MNRPAVVVALFALAACTAPPPSLEATDHVLIRSGSDWHGWSEWVFVPGDQLFMETAEPGGDTLRQRWIDLPPGTYVAARTAAETHMPNVIRDYIEPDFECPTDMSPASVAVAPPVQGIDLVRAQCADNDYAPLAAALAELIPAEAR